jgi:hypothetical protein
MGHYCWACGRTRPNEKFSGRGHRDHICKQCVRERKARRRARGMAAEVEPELAGGPPEMTEGERR